MAHPDHAPRDGGRHGAPCRRARLAERRAAHPASPRISLDLRLLGGHAPGSRLVLVHGTLTLNTVYLTEDRSDAFCRKAAASVGLKAGDVLAFGHTHKPWHRVVDGIHFVNTGSVGQPTDGDSRAGDVLLEYDIEATLAGVRAAGLPVDLVELLRTAGKPTTVVGG